jgi:LytS/YehU family sensor histidine kinase
MIVTILIAVGLLSALITQRLRRIKYLKLKQLQQINDLKLKAIRTKAIPHFTGNVYNNIDYLIEIQEYEAASNSLALLSRIHNKVLQDADKQSHSLKEELEFVEIYIKLEKLRYKENLKFFIEKSPSVDLSTQIPIMILHTYVENAIKHGLMSKKGKGRIDVKIDSDEIGVKICVRDDGIGRKEAFNYNKDSSGKGLSIFEQQIELYNLNNKIPILQTVTDLKDENGIPAGTEFCLFVPFHFSYLV